MRIGLALRLAGRGLLRNPGASLLAVAVLTLGLAAPTVFFSILVGATRPLPVPEGDRVVRVDVVQPSRSGRALPVRVSDLESLRRTGALQALGGFTMAPHTLVDPGHAAVRVSAARLTPEVFSLLRVQPALGRLPGADDTGDALVLGHDVWEEAYGGDPGVLGRTVSLDGALRTVVGVMPAGFGFPQKENAWTILGETPGDSAQVELVGRLADGADARTASAALGARWAAADPTRPAGEQGGVVQVEGYTKNRGGGGERAAFTGLVVVALCLLTIACANVANLLLVRATERVRALGIQAALGAGRAQIGAQLLLESLLIAVGGGAFGLLLARWVVDLLQRTMGPENLGYYWMRLAVDGRVLAFTSILVVGTALLAGILPMMRVLRVDVLRVLKEEAGAAAVGGGGRLSRAFVTGQLALSCGALVAAGLTGRSLADIRNVGRGVPAAHILLASVQPQRPDGTPIPGAVDGLEGNLAAIPAARATAVALGAPGYGEPFSPMEVGGTVYARPEDRPRVVWNAVSPGYFGVLDLRLQAGRGVAPTDVRGSPPVAVVSESWARRYSPSQPALGQRIRIAEADSASWRTIVGVVADAGLGGNGRTREDRVYVPLAQVEASSLMLLVRARGDPTALVRDVRSAVARMDPSIAAWDVRTLADAYAYMLRAPRTLWTIAFAGGLAGLLVAAVGLYGLLAFRVRQRRRELGVRLALGADGTRLVVHVLGMALRQLAPAVAAGLALAWLGAPILRSLLLGGDPREPIAYGIVAIVFMGTGLLAAAVPALRAARVDPALTLRGE